MITEATPGQDDGRPIDVEHVDELGEEAPRVADRRLASKSAQLLVRSSDNRIPDRNRPLQ